VLVDGVRVNDPTNARGGSFDLSALDVADVERVEIARGPYSAVYGGDALAGVINIVTRPGPAEKEEGLVVADIDLGMISLSKSVADPAGHYSRPDVTRLLLNKTPGDRVVANVMPGMAIADDGMGEPAVPSLVS
jgi:outer membrane cobalamin receptor